MDWSQGKFHLEVAGRSSLSHLSRFCISGHTRDLLVICCVAIALIIGVADMSAYSLQPAEKGGARIPAEWGMSLITLLLGIIGWSCQSANTRFGVADLFAGEIGALCRIAAVGGIMDQFVRRYYAGESPPPPANTGTDYFAVFNSNSKELEVLDGDVVGAVTQFYANIKIFQDCLRRPVAATDDAKLCRAQRLTAIYYGFLAFESARLAMAVLIDDRERSEEGILSAMLSELPAYFLLYGELFQQVEDVRWHRIADRLDGYRRLIAAIERELPRSRLGADLAGRVTRIWKEFESASQQPRGRLAAQAAA
jgi:hypothetical protein